MTPPPSSYGSAAPVSSLFFDLTYSLFVRFSVPYTFARLLSLLVVYIEAASNNNSLSTRGRITILSFVSFEIIFILLWNSAYGS